jgi:VanZ family protein
MSSNRRSLKFWISAWLPVVLGVIAVAMESTEIMGANHTSSPFRWLYQAIFGFVSDDRWEILHHLIRKTGHFIGYGTIGLTWLRAWWMTLTRSRFLHDSLLALLGTAMVASADEWHQTFLPNRTGSPWDVLLDCCGAIAMELAVYIFLRLFRPKRLAKAA